MIPPGPGTLLIADPFLQDPNFTRTVIFLCEHQENGSFGFVLNKKFPQTLDQLVDQAAGFPLPVFHGGPVQQDTLHFLHVFPELIPGGVEVIEDVYWGGDFETVLTLIQNKQLDARGIRFFLGYSGWGNGQLIDELNEKTWITAAATSKLIFHQRPSEVWQDSLRHLGGDYAQLIHYPIDPQLN